MTPPNHAIWSEDAEPGSRTVRSEPPDHAHRAAEQIFDRIASKPRRTPTNRTQWNSVGLGIASLIAATIVLAFQLDAGMVHLGSVMLGIVGLIFLLRGLMGY